MQSQLRTATKPFSEKGLSVQNDLQRAVNQFRRSLAKHNLNQRFDLRNRQKQFFNVGSIDFLNMFLKQLVGPMKLYLRKPQCVWNALFGSDQTNSITFVSNAVSGYVRNALPPM